MWYVIGGIFLIAATIGISVLRSMHARKLARLRGVAQSKEMDEREIDQMLETEPFLVPTWVPPSLIVMTVILFAVPLFNIIFFYAEPTYIYHVRTIFGQERVVHGTGYYYHIKGRVEPWKLAMSVTASELGSEALAAINASKSNAVSADLKPENIVFLDQVDADVDATSRYLIPTEEMSFLKMAHEYRTAENLLRTELVPAFKETLQATASLMTAEEYFSGSRTEFMSEFKSQMSNGIYNVKREEKKVYDETQDTKSTANAALGTEQKEFGGKYKLVTKVTKLLDKNLVPIRTPQKFKEFGIVSVSARVTDLRPNDDFKDRMKDKQKASADRAIAKEQRTQEVEQKLLAVATGDREVAQMQATWKKDQMKQTTQAQTKKQLALTNSNRMLEAAKIDKQTAVVREAQARIDASRIKVLAEADEYERKAKISGDNALDKKIAAEIEIQRFWANAYSQRRVPTTVTNLGGSGRKGSGPTVAGDSEVRDFMKIMTLQAAKNLNYDRAVTKVDDLATK